MEFEAEILCYSFYEYPLVRLFVLRFESPKEPFLSLKNAE